MNINEFLWKTKKFQQILNHWGNQKDIRKTNLFWKHNYIPRFANKKWVLDYKYPFISIAKQLEDLDG